MIKPAILQKELSKIQEQIKIVEDIAQIIHIDVADGVLVEGLTYLDTETLNNLESKAKFEIHLMVENPITFIPKIKGTIETLIFHVESNNVPEAIIKATQKGFKIGICISADTETDKAKEHLKSTDFVQFMTVIPGKQGQPFLVKVVDKIRLFKQEVTEASIQVDGHMNKEHIVELEKLGVDHYVVGSDIFSNACPTCEEINLEKLID